MAARLLVGTADEQEPPVIRISRISQGPGPTLQPPIADASIPAAGVLADTSNPIGAILDAYFSQRQARGIAVQIACFENRAQRFDGMPEDGLGQTPAFLQLMRLRIDIHLLCEGDLGLMVRAIMSRPRKEPTLHAD